LEDFNIVLNEITSEEFYRFGKLYYEEAKRILTHMPRLPSKYGNVSTAGNEFSYNLIQADQTKISTEQLMMDIQRYINDLIKFSPLIANLFYLRDFLTCNRSKSAS